MKLQTHLAVDRNGNKIVRLTFWERDGKRAKGFAIQTNHNLPKTHRSGQPDHEEILAWVRRYGTLRQKAVANIIEE